MNRILFTLLLVVTIFQAKANAVSAALDTASAKISQTAAFVDTSSTFKNMYSDVKAGIVGLATGLKVGVEHVYKILVLQQVVKSITWVVIILVLIGLSFLFVKIYKHAKAEWGDGVAFFFFTAFGGCGLLAGYIIVMCNLTAIITGFVNPEYGAIQDIVNFVRH